MSEPAIEGVGLGKRFRIPRSQYSTLKGRIVRPFARTAYDEFEALDDVTFRVEEGEFFGIVGRNGSGKSTLLKLIAGIYQLDRGMLRINGTIAPFIELGVGFNDDLNGRENLFLNGALLGLSRPELERKYDAIVEFAELEDFMELKLRNFSSGMQVRLAFSIALQAGADILLTDEVLAVGDERFQRKCFDVFREQKRRGQTVVFVSHDMGAVSQFCDRGMLLDRGRVVATGPIHEVVRAYHKLNEPPSDSGLAVPTKSRILDVWTERDDGESVVEFQHLDGHVTIAVLVEAGERLAEPDAVVGISVLDRFGHKVFGSNTELMSQPLGPLETGDQRVVRFRLENFLAGGRYVVSTELAWPTSGDVLDWRPDGATFGVQAVVETGGVVDFPHTVSVTVPDAADLAHANAAGHPGE